MSEKDFSGPFFIILFIFYMLDIAILNDYVKLMVGGNV